MRSEICLIFVILKLILIGAVPSNRSAKTGPLIQKSHQVNATRKFQGEFFPWDSFCEEFNVPDLTYFPHPDECNWYLVCWEDMLISGECDDNLWFNPATITCELPNTFECELGLYPEWGYPECPLPGSRDLVLLPSLYCDAFYICINGWPIEMQCRPGQHWNAERLYCDHPRNARCENGDSNFPPQDLPDCPIGFAGNLPHPDDCNLFIHCANGNRFIQRCPHLFNFDVTTAKCVIVTQASCIDEFRGRRRI